MAFHEHLAYRSANAPAYTAPAPAPAVTGNVRVLIESSDGNERAWYLPKSLLAHHSKFYARRIEDEPEAPEIKTGQVDPRAFQNFVDYMVSGIYNVQNRFPNYRAIVEHSMAYVIGEKLGSTTYCDIAIRSLHAFFLPIANFEQSKINTSPIRPSDIEYICTHAAVPTSSYPIGVQQLFFDAAASHWSRSDANNVLCHRAWAKLYIENIGFGATIGKSTKVNGADRAMLLRSVEEYLSPIEVTIKDKSVTANSNQH